MSADYTKVYRGFFEGSLRDQSPYSKLLFLAMMLHADENGVVLGSVSFWADYIKCSPDEVRESLRVLSSPDPESTSPDEEGRRIEPWGDGANRWRIVNYRKYYQKSRNEERREYKAEWIKNKRRQVSSDVDSVDPEHERKGKERKETTNVVSRPSRVFVAPSVEDVSVYMESRGWLCPKKRAAQFVAHYEANGWRRGKGDGIKIRDWQACVRTWESRGDFNAPTDNDGGFTRV